MDNEIAMIPFFVHEAEMTRAEKRLQNEKDRADTRTKRFWFALGVVFLSFLCANMYGFGLKDGKKE